MLDVLLDAVLDVLKAAPILFVVYILIGWLENRADAVTRIVTSAEPLGPLIGALVGAIPQCGFSVGCSALYCRGFLGPAALIAVYLSTSDEAIPVLLANGGQWRTVALLIAVKLAVAIVAGYVFSFIVFRDKVNPEDLPDDEMDMDEVTEDACCGGRSGLLPSALSRTVNTSAFLLATMLLLELVIYWIGEDTLASLLLGGTLLQPVLCALIGLLPGCAVSVLLTELFLCGTITFGSAIAGLSAGAGFGFVLLLREAPHRRDAWKIIGCTYLAAVAAGILLSLIA